MAFSNFRTLIYSLNPNPRHLIKIKSQTLWHTCFILKDYLDKKTWFTKYIESLPILCDPREYESVNQ